MEPEPHQTNHSKQGATAHTERGHKRGREREGEQSRPSTPPPFRGQALTGAPPSWGGRPRQSGSEPAASGHWAHLLFAVGPAHAKLLNPRAPSTPPAVGGERRRGRKLASPTRPASLQGPARGRSA